MNSNNVSGNVDLICKENKNGVETAEDKTSGAKPNYQIQMVWNRVVSFFIINIIMLYSYYLIFTLKVKWQTAIFTYVYVVFGTLGITAGVHRHWSHKSYKANIPMRILLMIMFTSTYQMTIMEWVRDHRSHHKFTDTNADPHNSRRGMIFSHIGWLAMRKHDDVKTKGKSIDMSDVAADPVVHFHQKNFFLLVGIFCFTLPTLIPWYFWGESYWYAMLLSIGKWAHTINVAASVNSFAHWLGTKPYDKNILPVENKIVSFITQGEGWHNYHHVFPYDYKAAELGNYRLNVTTCFVDLMSKIGWATELKTASEELILKRMARTGNLNHHHFSRKTATYDHSDDEDKVVFGWTDRDLNQEEQKKVKISSWCN